MEEVAEPSTAAQKPSTAAAPSLQVPTGQSTTFYKRKLPCPPAIAFSSPEGKQMFGEAFRAGTLEGFFPLIEQFSTQDEPAFCGLASLAMVLNSLRIDPKRKWKGPWRWFHEAMLDCCKKISDIVLEGIILDQAACVARCNGARVELVRQHDISLENFRQEVVQACQSIDQHMVVSYSRKAFLQTGDGHFSPVGGYHAGKDHVLILDVARFKYPSHWVPLPLLYEAMGYQDPVTGLPRGFLKIGASLQPSSVLFTLNLQSKDWQVATQFLQRIPEICSTAASQREAVDSVVQQAPVEAITQFVSVRTGAACCTAAQDSCLQPEAVRQMLAELYECPLYALVDPLPARSENEALDPPYWKERLCIYLLLAPVSMRTALTSLKDEPAAVTDISQKHQLLSAELTFLDSQLAELPALQEAHRLQQNACARD